MATTYLRKNKRKICDEKRILLLKKEEKTENRAIFYPKRTTFSKNVCGKVLQNEKRPWSSQRMTQGLKYYFQIRFTFEERIKEITSERINHFCWDSGIIPTLLSRKVSD